MAQGDRISYEHPGAPRAPRSAEDKPIGGYREEGFLWSAYRKGYRLGTIASSDHWSTHISYAMVYTEEPTRESIFEAIKKRRTYGATDNIVLDYRMGDTFMGEVLTASQLPALKIHVVGTSPIARIDIIKDEAVIDTGIPTRKRSPCPISTKTRNRAQATTTFALSKTTAKSPGAARSG